MFLLLLPSNTSAGLESAFLKDLSFVFKYLMKEELTKFILQTRHNMYSKVNYVKKKDIKDMITQQ